MPSFAATTGGGSARAAPGHSVGAVAARRARFDAPLPLACGRPALDDGRQVIGYDELRDTEVVVAASATTATLQNGVEVTVASTPALTVAVRFGAPAATSTEEDWFAPSSVLVHLLLGGTALADVGPASVTSTDAEGTRELAPTEWSYDAARRQLQVRLTADATLEVR